MKKRGPLSGKNERLAFNLVQEGILRVDVTTGYVYSRRKRGYEVPEYRCDRSAASDNGYFYVNCRSDDGKSRRALAHRLVWAVAHGMIPVGMTVNHKNGDKGDNRIENLELMTQREQIRHRYRVLKQEAPWSKIRRDLESRIRELECRLHQEPERFAQAIEGLPEDSTPQQCADHVRRLDEYEGNHG